ncbi:hypothetical protein CEXT_520641 [Caerostris extrusa]|uniref:Uncharacterized protein n=1 Tax=Caerostris extrusa TaxID=172846 RepID=A0AAV4PRP5_CAEEX|nr:hypothetical protein CEXT_520641 [Caerostris extrusa]
MEHGCQSSMGGAIPFRMASPMCKEHSCPLLPPPPPPAPARSTHPHGTPPRQSCLPKHNTFRSYLVEERNFERMRQQLTCLCPRNSTKIQSRPQASTAQRSAPDVVCTAETISANPA